MHDRPGDAPPAHTTAQRRPGTAGSGGHTRRVKTVVIGILGGLLTVAGIALLVLPGPGFVLVAAGLALLATQFDWARKPLDYAREKAVDGIEEVGRSRWRTIGAALCGLVLVGLGVAALAGVDLPLVNAVTAVGLIASGLFLIGTIVYARAKQTSGDPVGSG